MQRAALLQGGDAVFKITVCHRHSCDLGVDAAAVMLQGSWIITILCPAADKFAVVKDQIRTIPHCSIAIGEVVVNCAALFAGPTVSEISIIKLHTGYITLDRTAGTVVGAGGTIIKTAVIYNQFACLCCSGRAATFLVWLINR